MLLIYLSSFVKFCLKVFFESVHTGIKYEKQTSQIFFVFIFRLYAEILATEVEYCEDVVLILCILKTSIDLFCVCLCQQANQDVTQIVEIFSDQTRKFPWLLARLVRFTTEGSVLIFVTKKINSRRGWLRASREKILMVRETDLITAIGN